MKAKAKPLPNGLICECGRQEMFPPYVYAHWDDEMTFTCPDCGQEYRVRKGRGRNTNSNKLAKPIKNEN